MFKIYTIFLVGIIHSFFTAECSSWVKFNTSRFTDEEDEALIACVEYYGTDAWREVASHIPTRTPKQCKERYFGYIEQSYLWNRQEDERLMQLVRELGTNWKRLKSFFVNCSTAVLKNRYLILCRGIQSCAGKLGSQTAENETSSGKRPMREARICIPYGTYAPFPRTYIPSFWPYSMCGVSNYNIAVKVSIEKINGEKVLRQEPFNNPFRLVEELGGNRTVESTVPTETAKGIDRIQLTDEECTDFVNMLDESNGASSEQNAEVWEINLGN